MGQLGAAVAPARAQSGPSLGVALSESWRPKQGRAVKHPPVAVVPPIWKVDAAVRESLACVGVNHLPRLPG